MMKNKFILSFFLLFLVLIAGCQYYREVYNVPDVDVNGDIEDGIAADDISQDIDAVLQEEQIVTDDELDNLDDELTNLEGVNEQDTNDYEFEI